MDLELRRHIQEAEKSGRFMVSVTYLDENEKTLRHHLITRNFPRDDLQPSIEHIAGMVERKSQESDTVKKILTHPNAKGSQKEL